MYKLTHSSAGTVPNLWYVGFKLWVLVDFCDRISTIFYWTCVLTARDALPCICSPMHNFTANNLLLIKENFCTATKYCQASSVKKPKNSWLKRTSWSQSRGHKGKKYRHFFTCGNILRKKRGATTSAWWRERERESVFVFSLVKRANWIWTYWLTNEVSDVWPLEPTMWAAMWRPQSDYLASLSPTLTLLLFFAESKEEA